MYETNHAVGRRAFNTFIILDWRSSLINYNEVKILLNNTGQGLTLSNSICLC